MGTFYNEKFASFRSIGQSEKCLAFLRVTFDQIEREFFFKGQDSIFLKREVGEGSNFRVIQVARILVKSKVRIALL